MDGSGDAWLCARASTGKPHRKLFAESARVRVREPIRAVAMDDPVSAAPAPAPRVGGEGGWFHRGSAQSDAVL